MSEFLDTCQFRKFSALTVLAAALSVAHVHVAFAANVDSQKAEAGQRSSADTASTEKEQIKSFNEVLQDLVNEFAFDLRAKALNSLRTVAVRRVALGEGIPRSYESYLETQISDAFRKHSGTKVLQCTNCRIRRTVVENGRLVMTTPINNPQELDAIASQLGVEAWVDVSLLYQETSMVLGFHVFDAKSKELVWTKLYNTENIYKQKMEQKEAELAQKQSVEKEKISDYVLNTTLGWQLVPNVKDSASMLSATVRFAERFSSARHEVGTRFGFLVAPSSVLSDYPGIAGDPASSAEIVDGTSKEVILPFTKGFALSAFYSRIVSPDPLKTDGVVWGWELGAGTIVSTGYACFSVRTGAHMRMGKRFVLDVGGAYSLPTTISIRNKYKYTTPGGIGADVGFGVQF
ncbi:MAG: hypothetical protein FJY29_09065 [Betaproteobacteria bacterium]|nr:hypothetical protein [Betaproteobacteria bacterium]